MIEPLKDNILIKKDELKSAGGLYLPPDAAMGLYVWGTVVEIGPDFTNKRIVVGDRVLYTKLLAHQLDDKIHVLAKEDIVHAREKI